MKRLFALILCLHSFGFATSFTVNQNAQWHTTTDFTPNGTPGFGDTVTNAQYSLACEVGQVCDLGTVNSTSMTLGDGTHAASFTNNGTFALRGQGLLQGSPYDCSHGPTVALGTGSLTELDQNGGSVASGFITASGAGPCVPFTIGTSGDQCIWGVSSSTSNAVGSGSLTFTVPAGLSISVGNFVVAYKSTDGTVYVSGPVTAYSGTSLTINVLNYAGSGTLTAWNIVACPTGVTSINSGSANGVLLTEGATGNGSTAMNWNGFAITGCGSTSTTVGCFNGEFNNTFGGSEWLWTQGLLMGDGFFSTNQSYATAATVPISINSVISQGRLGNTDLYLDQQCSSGAYSSFVLVTRACGSLAHQITNSLLRDMRPALTGPSGQSDLGTEGMTISNVFWDGLGNSNPGATAANIAGGAWSYVVAATDIATCTEDRASYITIHGMTADHIYSICPSADGDNPIMLSMQSNASMGANFSLTYTIFDNPTTGASDAGHGFLYGNDGGTDTGYSMTIDHILILRNSLGFGGVGFTQWSSGCPGAPLTSITHVTQIAGSTQGQFYACEGNTNVAVPPALSTYKGNIFYDTSARTNPINFGNLNAAQPANVVLPAGTDYNVNWNFLPANLSLFTSACSPGCTNSGGPYDVPMTGATPGVHDMNVNPQFANLGANAYTWAATLGQAATYQGFRQVFANGGPSMIQANIQALFNYDCVGYLPTYSPIWHMLPDASTPGACEPQPPASALGGPVTLSGVQIH